MNNKIRQGWQSLTKAKANVWLTSVIVILFIITVAILNTLNLKYGETQARYLTGSSTITGATLNNGQPQLKLTAVPAQVAYSTDTITRKVYLTAEFSNATNCRIQGPSIGADGIMTAVNIEVPYTSQIPIEVSNAPMSSPNYFSYTLNCEAMPNSDGSHTLPLITTSTIVTFFDPHDAPTAELTAQELDLRKNISIENPTPSSDTITITDGNGVKLTRTCVNAQSGYITNERGTILSPLASRSKTSEVLTIKHDAQGTTTPPNGIHSDHTYTAHCFSGVNQNRQETTDTIDVVIR